MLPTTPWQAPATGTARDVELIAGHNRDEYRLFLALGGQLGQAGEEEAAAALRAFGPGPDGERSYRAAFPEASPAELHERVQSDWLFPMPSLRPAEAQVAGAAAPTCTS